MPHTKHQCSYWDRWDALVDHPSREVLLEMYEKDKDDPPCYGTFYTPGGSAEDPWGSAHDCQACIEEFHDEDGCARRLPRIGERTLIWVSAYAVTRHFGGREEGGWWYNAGELLATIPVPGVIGLPERGTDLAAIADSSAAIDNFKIYLEEMFKDMKHGNIYSVLGGVDVQISVEDHRGQDWPQTRPHYE